MINLSSLLTLTLYTVSCPNLVKCESAQTDRSATLVLDSDREVLEAGCSEEQTRVTPSDPAGTDMKWYTVAYSFE